MRFRVLGQVVASLEGERIPLGGPKPRLALALLLLEPNRTVPTDRLIEALWPRGRPGDPRAALQVNISNLRRALRATDLSIEFDNGGYLAAVDRETVDLHRFDAMVEEGAQLVPTAPRRAATVLRDALGLWRGRPFGDLADEPALSAEVARLETARLRALEKRIDADLAVGDHERALPELERLTDAHPLREGFWGQLMVALYRSGRQADAIAAYEEAAAALRDELGIDPSPALQDLHLRMLRQDESLRTPARPVAADADAGPGDRSVRGYRLLEEVGTGRMGTIFRGRQPGSDELVAVEVIGPDTADDPALVRTFQPVTERVARLEHPRVAGLVDAWREPGEACLVSEWVQGTALRPDRGDEVWRPDRVATVVADLAEVLDDAHRGGITAHDLRPDDVVIDERGRAVLTGLAGLALAGPRSRRPGPDARAEPQRPAAETGRRRPDVERLAALAFELLSGLPHRAVRVAAASGDRSGREPRLPPLGELRPDLPVAVGAVLARALSGEPAERFETAGALAAALGAAANDGSAHGLTTAVRNPYKGLQPFREADVGDFFGRSGLIDRLRGRIEAGSVAIVGPSGSGKSSVVRAGLLPRLREESWFVTTMQPGEWPMAELERCLTEVATGDPERVAHALRTGGREGLARAAAATLPDEDARLLIFVDQFEELYALARHEDRQAFLHRLAHSLTVDSPRIRVVLTIRADFYDELLLDPAVGPWVADHTLAVSALTAEQIEAAITGPARRVGVAVDPEVTATIVGEVAGSPGSLPLLQFALTELFEAREGGRITLASYEAVGGVSGALVGRAERLYADLTGPQQEVCRQVFLRLVTVGAGPSETRRRVLRAELLGVGAEQRVEAVLEAFGRHRLLTFDRDPFTRMPTVEIAHEALTDRWGRLRGWIDGAHHDILMHRRLRTVSNEWRLGDRDGSYLLRGARLDEVEEWAATSALTLTDAERSFVDESIDARERRRERQQEQQAREEALERRARRRLRIVAAVSVLAALVAAGLSLVAFDERGRARQQQAAAEQQRRIAEARELAAAAVAELDVDPQRGLLLAIEAVTATRAVDGTVVPEATAALHRAVVSSRMVERIPGVGGHLALSPDGLLVTEGPEGSGRVDVRDATTGAAVHAFRGHDPSLGDRPSDLNAVAFSPDGDRLATAGDDGTLRLWETEPWRDGGDGAPVVVPGDRIGAVWGPSFGPDGRRVAAAWADEGVVRVADVDTGDVVVEVERLAFPYGAAFSPDGSRLAVPLGRDGQAVVLDAGTGEQVLTLPGGSDPLPGSNDRGVAWSPDGRYLATTTHQGTASIWNAADGSLHARLYGHTSAVVAAAWSPDSRRLATGSIDGTARVWRLVDEGAREELVLGASPKGVQGLAFSTDAELLYTGEEGPAETTNVKIWDVSDGGTAEVANLPGAPDGPSSVAVDPADGRVLAASGSGTVTVWNLAVDEATVESRISGEQTLVHDIEVSPDGAVTAIAAGPRLRLVDRDTSEVVREVEHAGLVGAVAWSSDGQHVASGDEFGSVKVVDRNGTDVASIERPGDGRAPGWGVSSLAFDGTDELLAVAGGNQIGAPDSWHVELWDWRAGELERTLDTGQFNARTIAFDPAGDTLAAGGFGSVELFDTTTWERTTELTGHAGGGVNAVAFAPDGTSLATAGVDGTVKLWDPAAGRETLTLEGHRGAVESLAFSPDGARLVSGDRRGRVRVWALSLDELLEIARRELTRELTDAECRQHLHTETC